MNTCVLELLNVIRDKSFFNRKDEMAATSVVIMFKENFMDISNPCSTSSSGVSSNPNIKNNKKVAIERTGFKSSSNESNTDFTTHVRNERSPSPPSSKAFVADAVTTADKASGRNPDSKPTSPHPSSSNSNKKPVVMSPYSTRTNIMNWLKDTKDAGAPILGQSLIG